DIFRKVLGDYPSNLLRNKLKARNKSVIKYTVQYNETNFQFLSRMAAEYGEWFYYNGKELLLGKEETNEVEFLIDGVQSFDMAIELNPTKFRLAAYDYTKHQDYTEEPSGSVEGLSDLGKFALKQSENLFTNKSELESTKPIFNASEISEFGKYKRAVSASKLIEFKGSGELPEISVGTVITVKGNMPEKGGRSRSQDFGKYLITKVTHTVDSSGNYSNSFHALPESVNYPPPNPYVQHPIGQTELAKVVDNKDPDNLGRVKVQFMWPVNDNQSDWIRVSTFYSGGSDCQG
ncbi:MAG: hypothetical protein C4308_09585, partial [Chitinophagaceae bacterium]